MKVLIYTNLLTPYRKYLYDLMNEVCLENGDQFNVLVMADNEKNRIWHYNDYASSYSILLKGKTISIGETYIHLNLGLKKILKSIKPDVVIASGSYLCPGTWLIAKQKKNLGYKALFWSESHLGESRNFGGIKRTLREIVRNIFYKRFDGFLYPGKLAKDFIKAYARKKTKYILLPNIVDESLYLDNKKEFARYDNKIHLFTPARLSEVKGIGPFLELLARCEGKERIIYKIAGDGELKESLEKKANELGIAVEFLGNQKPDVISDLYKECDGFVLPSLSDPNPLSCIEALWSGKPILVSNHVGNYPEVVDEGNNGFVFSYNEPEKAIRIISSFIQMDSEWRIEACKRSKAIACKVFSSRFVVSRALKLLNKV